MGYSLFLRSKLPEGRVNREQTLDALKATGLVTASEGMFLSAGAARLACSVSDAGVDFELPFGAPEADFRASLLLGAELGAKLDLALIDPQRNAEVTPASAEESVKGWIKANQYAVGLAGRVEDVRNALPVEPLKSQWNTRSKVLVGLVATVVVVYELMVFLLGFLETTPRPID